MAQNLYDDYVAKIGDKARVKIVQGFEILEDNGAIGDHPVRMHAEEFLRENGIPQTIGIVFVMASLTTAVYKYYSKHVLDALKVEE